MSVQLEYKDGIDEAYEGLVESQFGSYNILSKNFKALALNDRGTNSLFYEPGKFVVVDPTTTASRESNVSSPNDSIRVKAWLLGVATLKHTGNVKDFDGETIIREDDEIGVMTDGVIWVRCLTAIRAHDLIKVLTKLDSPAVGQDPRWENIGRVITAEGTALVGYTNVAYADAYSLTTIDDANGGLIKLKIFGSTAAQPYG